MRVNNMFNFFRSVTFLQLLLLFVLLLFLIYLYSVNHLLFGCFLLLFPCYYFEKKKISIMFKLGYICIGLYIAIIAIYSYVRAKPPHNIIYTINLYIISTIIFSLVAYLIYCGVKYVKIRHQNWIYNYKFLLFLILAGGLYVAFIFSNIPARYIETHHLYTLNSYIVMYRSTFLLGLLSSGLIALIINIFTDKDGLQKRVIQITSFTYLGGPILVLIFMFIGFTYPLNAVMVKFPSALLAILGIFIFRFSMVVAWFLAIWGSFLLLFSKKISLYVIISTLILLSILLIVYWSPKLIAFPFYRVHLN